ncbi:MAG: RNA 3'-terminal phosphate cyclase [Acidobacteriota bacterium]|nr:MAG: RNA 3'-terminal phosphate cyclase [Acidobacteriota bacterium]
MVTVDGARGEGGGQVLRTSLTLSLSTGQPLRIVRIRARRRRPGLMRQHLTAVRAAAAISRAQLEGAALGATELTFEPGQVQPGEYAFDVGSAGSACLVLQTILLPLLTAGGRSRLRLEGGTHNPLAPPFDFIDKAYLPPLRRMGARVEAVLERPGFFPAGGGRIAVRIEPTARLEPIELVEAGPILGCTARAVVANLPRHIAERELSLVREQLGWPAAACRIETASALGAGNMLALEIAREALTEVVCAFGRRGVPAERVAAEAVAEVRRYLDANAPVGPHLADQLLLPLALAGGGAFRTCEWTDHARTNAEVIRRFLPFDLRRESAEKSVLVRLSA